MLVPLQSRYAKHAILGTYLPGQLRPGTSPRPPDSSALKSHPPPPRTARNLVSPQSWLCSNRPGSLLYSHDLNTVPVVRPCLQNSRVNKRWLSSEFLGSSWNKRLYLMIQGRICETEVRGRNWGAGNEHRGSQERKVVPREQETSAGEQCRTGLSNW